LKSTALDIGFIGLGIMGAPMCARLVEAGHRLSVHSRSAPPSHLVDSRVTACADARAVARRSDIVILMLPDTPDVDAVLFAETGVASGLSRGKVVIDMSSISPLATKQFAQRIGELGCDYLDAPVSGGELGAKNGTLTIMVGGEPQAFQRATPIFETLGRNVTLVGRNGDGQTAKVANQIIVALNIEAVAEALLFAARAGADPARVREALMGGFASSKVLEVHGERMIKRTFQPGFRVALHQKDLNLALSSARSMGLSLPATAAVQELFNSCAAHGGQALDHSSLVNAIERLANFEMGQVSD
jgi:2-hydroxy-3-oxopropionate reductase